MANQHTVEKIGGTSMTRFDEVMNNVIIQDRTGAELYQRIFVVSAYGGITNLLLENKKNGEPGVYAKFAKGDKGWVSDLEKVRKQMHKINRSFEKVGLEQKKADAFVDEHIDGVTSCLKDLMRVRAYGHLCPEDYLPPSREFLSSIGEAHSAYNSSLILQANGVNAIYVDLTCWKETEILSLEDVISRALSTIDLSTQLPIVTGYVKCESGLMGQYDRGYSEITFSKLAAISHAKEGIIHKEYHLSTGDPALMGVDKVKIIGNTNFDIADQMADMDMEAIHSKASKELESCNIPIRVKNAFDPQHPGTLISKEYFSPEPKVELICGRDDLLALKISDSEMVGKPGYDYALLKSFVKTKVSYISKSTNANTIVHYIPQKTSGLKSCLTLLSKEMPNAQLLLKDVAIVAVLGTNMKDPRFLAKASTALADAGINILGLDHCMPQVNIQFVIEREQFENAQLVLHKVFVENE